MREILYSVLRNAGGTLSAVIGDYSDETNFVFGTNDYDDAHEVVVYHNQRMEEGEDDVEEDFGEIEL